MDSREREKAKNTAWEKHKFEGEQGWEASPFEMFDAGWQARDSEIEPLRKQLASLQEILDEQLGEIRGLNMCIGGEDSLTANNLVYCSRYLDDEKCLIEVIKELSQQLAEAYEIIDKKDEAFEALKPLTRYGIVGSKDIEQAKMQRFVDEALALKPKENNNEH